MVFLRQMNRMLEEPFVFVFHIFNREGTNIEKTNY